VLTIRRATADDAATLAELAERTFRDTFARDNRAEDMEAYAARTYGEERQRREIENRDLATLLAEDDGVAVAFAQLALDRGPGRVEIARFYVDRAYHGRGIAQALMQATREAAQAHGAERVFLGVWERNARAIAFYAKCGFVDIGSQPFLLGSDLQTDRVMEYTFPRR
jgi:ribosomal protein S18 acetylase RimI-like enzyme